MSAPTVLCSATVRGDARLCSRKAAHVCDGKWYCGHHLQPRDTTRARRIAEGHALLVATVEAIDAERWLVPHREGTFPAQVFITNDTLRALVRALGMVRS